MAERINIENRIISSNFTNILPYVLIFSERPFSSKQGNRTMVIDLPNKSKQSTTGTSHLNNIIIKQYNVFGILQEPT